MTKNEIITNLFLSKNFRDCVNKMEPEHLRDDLKSEVMLVVCEMEDQKVIQLHQRKELEFYTVRIILNLVKSNTSPFAKKYRQVHATINYLNPVIYSEADNFIGYCERFRKNYTSISDHPIEAINAIVERAEREQKEDAVISEIDNLYWYKAELVQLYRKHGNYRAIEADTGIPYISCYKTIKQSFQELRDKLNIKAV